MTINVAIVTSEALVLACDSLISFTRFFVDASACPSERQPDGSIKLTALPPHFVSQVTKTQPGMTKMFALSDGHTPVAAVCSGLARLNGRTMRSYARQFLADSPARTPPETVEEIAEAFLTFMRMQYERHYAGSSRSEQYRDAPFFLVGGYGKADHHPSLYRIDVLANEMAPAYLAGTFGLSYEGQTRAIERVVLGFDDELRQAVETEILAGGDGRLRRFDWSRFEARVEYAELTVQEAVDFASYLVLVQCGAARFGPDTSSVGGRILIGIVDRTDGFRILTEDHAHPVTYSGFRA